MKINLADKITTQDTIAVGIWKSISGDCNYNQELPKEILDIVKYTLNHELESYKETYQKIFCLKKGRGFVKILVWGLGEQTEDLSVSLRNAAANLVRFCIKEKLQNLSCILPDNELLFFDYNFQALLEGFYLGNYCFDQYKSKKEISKLQTLTIAAKTVPVENFSTINKTAEILSKNVILARDLTNMPANELNPKKIAKLAEKMVKKLPLKINVLSEKELQKNNLNALLAVASGSTNSPYMIVLNYQGAPENKEVLGLVGKGVTFDSGGISLKPAEGMQEMKDDMAGAATVLGSILAIAELGLSCNVLAVIPCVENMPSGNAYRPGDIITAMNGKTIEIISTDAEGRLILADALCYAENLGATKIIDVATLTGACMVALGQVYAGSITNSMEFHDLLSTASKKTDEKLWLMPNDQEYKKLLKSEFADLKNSGGRFAGMISAGLFLEEFVSKNWIHIDIAPTATVPENNGYISKGATGYGVRLLVQLVQEVFKC